MQTAAKRTGLMVLEDALDALLASAVPLTDTEALPTVEADGRVLSHDVLSALDVPGHDNTSMDGYAVRVGDVREALETGRPLTVSQRIPAGHRAEPLRSGTVARVFTGAAIPLGADAVVMQEEAETVGDADGLPLVRFQSVPLEGQWIRRQGEDVRKGAAVLRRGQRLGPAELGLAASIGCARLTVVRRLRVALLSTGDELVMPGDVPPEQMRPGAIYNSNRFFLRTLLQRWGCEVTDLGLVPDRRDATIDALSRAAAEHDLIVTSGGVSVGEEDHIKPAVQQLGALDLWQIGMKPGKPFAHGWVGRGDGAPGRCHFIGLPGNPVSSFVTLMLLARPLVLRLQGVDDPALARLPQPLHLPAHFDWPKADKRREFLRVRRNAAGGLDVYPNQSSGVLTSVSWADGLVDNPAGTTIARGDIVAYLPFDRFMN